LLSSPPDKVAHFSRTKTLSLPGEKYEYLLGTEFLFDKGILIIVKDCLLYLRRESGVLASLNDTLALINHPQLCLLG
jgi:hypothetical protein